MVTQTMSIFGMPWPTVSIDDPSGYADTITPAPVSAVRRITVCTQDRPPLFGDVVNGVMVPNAMGAIVQRCWDAIPDHMPAVVCDAFVVMPNHVHGIIMITDVAAGEIHWRFQRP